MQILTIGNSFSQDAVRYLHSIAKSDGYDITVVNMYIGGCSLSRHYRNMLSDSKDYTMEFNGQSTGFNISLKDALLSRDWDYVTFQQASPCSPNYDSYQPYLSELSEYVKKLVPKAKQLIHQTWAYEEGSQRLTELMNYKSHEEMYFDIKNAYKKAAEDIKTEFIIPSGEAFYIYTKMGIENIHRDTYHANLGFGRYTLGLIWYKALTNRSVMDNTFCDFDEEISPERIALAKDTAEKLF